MSMRFLAAFLLTTGFAIGAEPDHVRIDPKRNWEPIVYSTNAQHPAADVVSIDLKGDRARFCSYDANKWGTFQYRLHIPVDAEKLPIVVLRYRATNLDTGSNTAALYIDNSAGGSIAMRPVAALNELVSDGKDQELRIDLRDHHIAGVFSGFMLCLMATESQTATVEISEIRLEAPPEAEHVEPTEEAPLTVTVTDAHDKPIAGAKATIDAERLDAARSAKTDAQGKVTLTPLSNESGQHMLEIDADYQATTMVDIPRENKDPISVQLTPGLVYGGFIQNERGKPIEGATVRIFAPPPQGRVVGNYVIRRAVVRTDAQGRWTSPVMPDEGNDPMFKLAHPDYVCDKEYNDTPLPPIDELKSGIGVMVMKKP